MKNLIILSMLLLAVTVKAQKPVLIYEDQLTHNRITAIFEDDSEQIYYTNTYAKPWTGKMVTVMVKSGSYDEMNDFFNQLLEFGEDNKDVNSTAEINGTNVSIKKKIGAYLIEIETDDIPIYTSSKELKYIVNQMKQYRVEYPE